jgi:c-di-GMP-binding flagellar brake protein YcgR
MGLFRWKKTADQKGKDLRRRHERISILLRINYEAANGISRYNCRTKDISEGGVRFGLYQRLKISMALKIHIYLQGAAESVLLLGSVAWIKETSGKEYPYEVGIKFDECCVPSISKIKDHIQSILIEKKE